MTVKRGLSSENQIKSFRRKTNAVSNRSENFPSPVFTCIILIWPSGANKRLKLPMNMPHSQRICSTALKLRTQCQIYLVSIVNTNRLIKRRVSIWFSAEKLTTIRDFVDLRKTVASKSQMLLPISTFRLRETQSRDARFNDQQHMHNRNLQHDDEQHRLNHRNLSSALVRHIRVPRRCCRCNRTGSHTPVASRYTGHSCRRIDRVRYTSVVKVQALQEGSNLSLYSGKTECADVAHNN